MTYELILFYSIFLLVYFLFSSFFLQSRIKSNLRTSIRVWNVYEMIIRSIAVTKKLVCVRNAAPVESVHQVSITNRCNERSRVCICV